ncbi:choice-of-anchor M domain-containing protein, partial [Corynebacterium phocae]
MKLYALSLGLAAGLACAPAAWAQEDTRYLIRDNHQDVHLLKDGSQVEVLLRDDGSRDKNSHSAYRPSGTVYVGVCGNAVQDSAAIKAELGIDVGPKVFNLPEVQKPGIPWMGFSTLGIYAEDISGASTMPLQMQLNHKPSDTARVVLWKQASLSQPASVLLDSFHPSQQWDFPVHTHAHTGILFTEPGRYEATFSYNPEFTDATTGGTSYTVDFLVGSAAVAAATADKSVNIVEQGSHAQPPECASEGQWPAHTPEDKGSSPRQPAGTAKQDSMPQAITQGINELNGALKTFSTQAGKFIEKNRRTTVPAAPHADAPSPAAPAPAAPAAPVPAPAAPVPA